MRDQGLKMEINLEDNTKTPINNKEDYQKALTQAKEMYRCLKKSLKTRSKSQLIQIIAKYASDLQELQELNKFLYEENKQLQESKNDKQDSKDDK